MTTNADAIRRQSKCLSEITSVYLESAFNYAPLLPAMISRAVSEVLLDDGPSLQEAMDRACRSAKMRREADKLIATCVIAVCSAHDAFIAKWPEDGSDVKV